MSVSHHRDVVSAPGGTTRATTASHRFSPGQVLSGLLGIVVAIMGIVAVTRAGIDGSLNQPVTQIFGITHSSYVGLFELAAGLLLLVGATSAAARALTGFVGGLMVIGGVVLAAGNLRILLDVGAKQSTGWMLVVFGAVAIVAAMIPSFVRSERVVETTADVV